MLLNLFNHDSFVNPNLLFDGVFSVCGLMDGELCLFELDVLLSTWKLWEDLSGLVDVHVAVLSFKYILLSGLGVSWICIGFSILTILNDVAGGSSLVYLCSNSYLSGWFKGRLCILPANLVAELYLKDAVSFIRSLLQHVPNV